MKTKKRTWQAGRPKFTEGDLKLITLKISEEQYDWLKAQGEISATIRALIDRARQR